MALMAALEGRGFSNLVRPELDKLIAMFPNEDLRDPNSPYFKTAYHDIPTDDPELLQALLQRCAEIVAKKAEQQKHAAEELASHAGRPLAAI